MTMAPEPITLLARFADASARVLAAQELARVLEVDRVLLFVRDPELGSLVPAPGFPQTIRGGPAWRAFVRSCARPGRYETDVDEVDGSGPAPHVIAHVQDRVALVLFGRHSSEKALAATLAGLPLIGAMLQAEHAARLAEGRAKVAQAMGRHANDLAVALDGARLEVERALSESARLNAALEERDRRKDDFLAMLGHELRNPMAAISGAIELMRARPEDLEQQRKARSVLERQAVQLARLVDDLLDVARITRGKVVLRLERLEVGALVQRAVDAARSAASAKRHELSVELRAEVHAQADPTRLEQMVANLITNAIKYTDPGGHIRVVVDDVSGEAVISVQDDGIGIPAHVLPRIFDAFHQVDPGIDRAAGGLGVGLTVASRLAALHEGRIEVESTVGRGSTFTIRIPADKAPAAASASEVAGSPAPSSETKEGARVLVVDDNVDSGEMIIALLESWGYEAHHATDGPMAVDRAIELRPDIVLLDIGLPGMDGYEVAARLRADPTTRGARILALSGYGQRSDRLKSSAAGCDDHLVKPVDVNLLRQKLTSG